jgi:release factor glutamine methyltransferase
MEVQGKVVSGLELWQWWQQAREMATQSDISPDEVDWLLQEIAGLDRLALRLESFKHRPEIALSLPLSELDKLWQRRICDRFPIQYIAGFTPWRHFSLKVSPAVLIPRPETEYLIDLAVAAVKQSKNRQSPITNYPLPITHWADLGTGSGAIALGLTEAFPSAIIHAVDSSRAALSLAQENAQRLGFADRIRFYQGSWFEPLEALKGQLSGMVSNPPYIPSSIVPTLQPEVAFHEPHLALDGGADGLDCIRHLVETAPEYLQPGGIWLVEMMAGQPEAVTKLLQNQGSYCQIEIHADFAGIERFAVAYRC